MKQQRRFLANARNDATQGQAMEEEARQSRASSSNDPSNRRLVEPMVTILMAKNYEQSIANFISTLSKTQSKKTVILISRPDSNCSLY